MSNNPRCALRLAITSASCGLQDDEQHVAKDFCQVPAGISWSADRMCSSIEILKTIASCVTTIIISAQGEVLQVLVIPESQASFWCA